MTEQVPIIPSKHWFSDGATMVFPSRQRTFFWLVNLFLYVLLNMFLLRIQQGVWLQLDAPYHSGPLIPELLSPLNIFQFPTYGIVVGLTSAMLCTVPILISLLYNLLTSVPFILAVLLFGHNPILSLCLFVSCALVGFEPLRFKSKFVSAVVGLTPVMVYWGLFSGENPEQDILRWAMLYAPWALAFLASVVMFAVILGLGHFLRYRPGVMMPIFAAVFAATLLLFHHTIGMHERDFLAEAYSHSPGQVRAFRGRSVRPLLEQELTEQRQHVGYLTDETIMRNLRLQWRRAFQLRHENGADASLNPVFQTHPDSLARRMANEVFDAQFAAIDHIRVFLQRSRSGRREPDAMYYLALLYDLNVDHRALRDDDYLQFYWDYPSPHSEHIWHEIVERFGIHPVSVPARHRLALLAASRLPAAENEPFRFREALNLLEQAMNLGNEILRQRAAEQQNAAPGALVAVFSPRPRTVPTEQLTALRDRIEWLQALIRHNRTGHRAHDERLARFIGLDPHQLDYDRHLASLKINAPENDPLIDNIEFALAQQQTDFDKRLSMLDELINRYPETDGHARSVLMVATLLLERRERTELSASQEQQLERARAALPAIIKSFPDSIFARRAQALLDRFPS